MTSSGSAGPASSPLRVAIAGATGRMGRMLVEAVIDAPDCRLAGAIDVQGNPALGEDASAFLGRASGIAVTADLAAGLGEAAVLIDFTRPAGTLEHLVACRAAGVAAVIGTTGFDAGQKAEIRRFAEALPIVFAPNMSVGVNVLLQLVAQAARALGDEYDVEIIEAHHRHKVDAPSGTALQLGEAVAAAQGRSLQEAAAYARHGLTGPRSSGSIGFASVRGGDIIGDHTVLFAGTGERIEISHRSSSRATYAQGALRAARFAAQRAQEGRPGLYDMDDVLGWKA
ncbi:MAG TPA: 4-hydroxy-tetrahydrodipicolinate reductase [Burkholderiaceae bacterium]|nr:4-hydroxy-tetrahydrodipicolinate reductase [Burkholderiaceae bacterium]